MIEWTISVGNIGQFIATLIAVVWLFASMKSDITLIRRDIQYIQDKQSTLTETITQLSTILTKIAVQDTRLSMIEKNLDELKHGQGYIKPI